MKPTFSAFTGSSTVLILLFEIYIEINKVFFMMLLSMTEIYKACSSVLQYYW